jgi:tryptophan-rich sensory protein
VNRKIAVIAALGVFLLLYLTVGVPWLVGLVEARGILTAFPIFLGVYAVVAYMLGAVVGHGPRALVLFVLIFLLGDIWAPPLLVGQNGEVPSLPAQQLASDVFFFTLFTSQGVSVQAAWWLTYLVVPILIATVLVFEIKSRAVSRFIPQVML